MLHDFVLKADDKNSSLEIELLQYSRDHLIIIVQ